ncbi:hypothetical protein HNY73_007479 [Argiope bruennichi]|uniref:Uncharacterized protein n=1 Tax=Argiope bruennichi TaxID=94029 RepID=A0A8T0FH42_ARGBR|nr:hypothetical protein HNY73_007479 [Argiope bruennichi]
MSPFLIQKYIQSTAGNVTSVKKLRSGDLLIETATPKQSEQLLAIKNFGDAPIEVSGHKTLNYTRGVISSMDLTMVSDEEFVSELQSFRVTSARRITLKRDGKIIPTKHVILTFATHVLPRKITAGTPKPGLSYSGAMKSTLKCTGSQTEITDIITMNTCSCKHSAHESVKSNNSQKTETNRNQASSSTKNSPPVSQPKDSEFSLARFPKKRKKAKSPSAKRSDTEIPPKPPDIPTTSDSVLSICPSTSDISDVEMDQHFPNKSPPGGHTDSNTFIQDTTELPCSTNRLRESILTDNLRPDDAESDDFIVYDPQKTIDEDMINDYSHQPIINPRFFSAFKKKYTYQLYKKKANIDSSIWILTVVNNIGYPQLMKRREMIINKCYLTYVNSVLSFNKMSADSTKNVQHTYSRSGGIMWDSKKDLIPQDTGTNVFLPALLQLGLKLYSGMISCPLLICHDSESIIYTSSGDNVTLHSKFF